MNDDTLNMETRTFLKKVGITSQREIEHAVLKAIENGQLSGTETLGVSVTLTIPSLSLEHQISGEIALQ